MSEPLWSIILASRNGADTLPRCLSALEASVADDAKVEVLLVDNASTDETSAILAEFASRLGARFITEPRAGKAFALNAAIDLAAGQCLLFIDDDILTSPHWLKAYRDAARDHPESSLLAGQIKAHWDSQPPLWLAEMAKIGKACGCTNPLAEPVPYSPLEVKGGNFAVRRGALGDVRFDQQSTNLGSTEKRVTGGLDTKMAVDLFNTGVKIVHVPEASVLHIINSEEVRPGAVFRRQMRIGRNYAAMNRATFGDVTRSVAKVMIFALAAPVGLLFGRQMLAGRSIMGLATNIGRLDRWFS